MIYNKKDAVTRNMVQSNPTAPSINIWTGVSTVLLLKKFTDVLRASLKGKNFTYRVEPLAPVPDKSLELWKSRGYAPANIGVAYVKFQDATKEYIYPAYFWSE